MTLFVHNTLGNRKERFAPLVEGKVGMYVCGVTVYDLCHIGHARANVAFDVIVRYLRYSGYEVKYVRNFTDIDDKIIRRANERGTDYLTIARTYIDAFYEDFDRMGLVRPDVEPKATEHIPEIVDTVSRLVALGKAYAADNGDVYYRVRSFPEYCKLSGKKVEELQAGARIEVGESKEDPLDFALWKASKPGEPSWDSPWGAGRPGWHIECTAMAIRHLGETFDIHGGGEDLVFPHHENEIAQSEGVTGKPFARYWLHNAFVNVDNEKMSKSLGNFFTLRDVLEAVHPEVLRFFFSRSHYRTPINYSGEVLADAKAGLDRLYRVKEKAEGAAAAGIAPGALPAGDEYADLLRATERFRESMDDDFNTAAAVGHLNTAVTALNRLAPSDPAAEPERAASFLAGFRLLEPLFGVLGILSLPAAEYFRAGAGRDGVPTPEEIGERIAERTRLREVGRGTADKAEKGRLFAEADRIRQELSERGVLLEDGPGGTTWKYGS